MCPMIRTRVFAAVFGALLFIGVVAMAQRPVRDISEARHPNLAAAQRLSIEAWERIVDAQRANEGDMRGHAERAKELLVEVNRELKLAAEAAHHHER